MGTSVSWTGLQRILGFRRLQPMQQGCIYRLHLQEAWNWDWPYQPWIGTRLETVEFSRLPICCIQIVQRPVAEIVTRRWNIHSDVWEKVLTKKDDRYHKDYEAFMDDVLARDDAERVPAWPCLSWTHHKGARRVQQGDGTQFPVVKRDWGGRAQGERPCQLQKSSSSYASVTAAQEPTELLKEELITLPGTHLTHFW